MLLNNPYPILIPTPCLTIVSLTSILAYSTTCTWFTPPPIGKNERFDPALRENIHYLLDAYEGKLNLGMHKYSSSSLPIEDLLKVQHLLSLCCFQMVWNLLLTLSS